ncbi:hypothetical protein T07_1724 [Trichinella nelsoni]|uniref:Uncharacterized protein n=1 Tax=Trichinella nelsoni TaxID=6336 RepID=A0A0V0SKD7_9BILA|nr:hypothetical protein T07_1724 [Trichinella nelsoni]
MRCLERKSLSRAHGLINHLWKNKPTVKRELRFRFLNSICVNLASCLCKEYTYYFLQGSFFKFYRRPICLIKCGNFGRQQTASAHGDGDESKFL